MKVQDFIWSVVLALVKRLSPDQSCQVNKSLRYVHHTGWNREDLERVLNARLNPMLDIKLLSHDQSNCEASLN